jgi:glycerophosphoryl diester phosphodiesterase
LITREIYSFCSARKTAVNIRAFNRNHLVKVVIAIIILVSNYLKSMLVLGHRGANNEESTLQENTMEAFQQALRMGAHGIETDVRLTHDEIPVLHHDSIKDTTNELTTLVELLDWAPDDFLINLEIKDPAVIPYMVELMNQYDKRYLVTSFWHRSVLHFQKEMPHVDCGPIISFSPIFAMLLRGIIPAGFTHVVWDCRIVEPEVISQFSEYQHFAYNVDNYEVSGFDGIISDDITLYVDQ